MLTKSGITRLIRFQETGYVMEYKETIIAAAKMSPAWIGIAFGHLMSSITLSGIAYTASIAYSVVHTIATLRNMRKG
jgi:hypothetical protein